MYYNYCRNEIKHPSIVSHAIGDVNGDRILDNVYLTGVKTTQSPFIQNITMVIQDGRTGILTTVHLSENAGYNPRLFLGDFTGDGIADILISIDSGGSGAIMYHYIYSSVNNKVQLLFDFNVYNNQYKYQVNYKDNYKVEVISEANDKKYIIDISNKGTEYLSEIYNPDGKLKNPISGFVNPLSGLYPVDFNSDKIYELLAYQKVAGRYNADALGYILNTLRWNYRVFSLDSQYLAIFGA
ncbi:MAG: VCBS repeat-containing protein [Bacillota bacterium]|nr:VCBS repeat-containing protein [Bacillota bacterium]